MLPTFYIFIDFNSVKTEFWGNRYDVIWTFNGVEIVKFMPIKQFERCNNFQIYCFGHESGHFLGILPFLFFNLEIDELVLSFKFH